MLAVLNAFAKSQRTSGSILTNQPYSVTSTLWSKNGTQDTNNTLKINKTNVPWWRKSVDVCGWNDTFASDKHGHVYDIIHVR